MNSCDLDKQLLDGFVDGELSPDEQSGVESHLAACSACREDLAELRRLIGAARDLEGIEPGRDLFPGIAAAISTGAPATTTGNATVTSRRSPRWLMAAAAVLLALLAGTAGWWWRGAPQPTQNAAAGPVMPLLATSGSDSAALRELVATTEQLANLVEARRERISPATAAVLEKNLAIIDRAIGELRQYPEAEDAGGERLALSAMYMQKLELLRRATRLSF